jgi:hypothetical protein
LPDRPFLFRAFDFPGGKIGLGHQGRSPEYGALLFDDRLFDIPCRHTFERAGAYGALGISELGGNDLMRALGLSHRPTFRENYLKPALEDKWIERTQPDSPHSPIQRYRLTGKGRRWLQNHVDK